MYNDTDITYSFNLDNYINSLESNYSFNDYKILVNNKDYNTLSIEHERLIIDINNRINSLDTLSIESFSSTISKFISWFKDMINRLITMISTFIKRIIAKIYELTLKSKDGLYKEFKSQIFTSVNIPIKDRKLNPNMINDMEKYCEMINNWNVQFQNQLYSQSDYMYKEQHEEDKYLKSMSTVLNKMKKDGVGQYVDDIFYIEKQKSNTTIREYFGCNAGETPKQLIILSDEYKDKLVKVKNETEKFLKELKSKKNLFLSEKKFTNNEERVNGLKKIIKNITYFHNMNYTFFIKSVNVRAKVAKYILKGSLGNLFEQLAEQDPVDEEELLEIKKYHKISFEVFRDIPNTVYDVELDSKNKAKVIISPVRKTIEILMNLEPNGTWYNKFFQYAKDYAIGGHRSKSQVIRKLFPVADYNDGYLQYRQNNTHLHLFPELKNLFQIPVDITKYCTLKFMEPVEQNRIKTDFPINFKIDMVISNERHVVEENDRLYHSISDNKTKVSNYLTGFFRNAYLFTESRVYFGLGQPMTPHGDTENIDAGGKFFLLKAKPGEIVYKDPEFSGGRIKNKKTACYILKDKIDVEDISNLIYCMGERKYDRTQEKMQRSLDEMNKKLNTK